MFRGMKFQKLEQILYILSAIWIIKKIVSKLTSNDRKQEVD